MNEITVIIGFIMFAWVIYSVKIIKEHLNLVIWLKDHAPMTWETYKRLGKCKKN
jgi:hypothetical protein